MQESVSMHKSPTPLRHSRMNQGRKKRKKRGRETGKTEAKWLMERKTAQQNKNTSEELKKGLSTQAQAEVNKEGGGRII